MTTNQTTNVDETLETAAERNFVVALQTKGGAKKAHSQVVVVQAHSILGAKKKAFLKMKTQRFKHSTMNHWQFTSVQEVSNTPEEKVDGEE